MADEKASPAGRKASPQWARDILIVVAILLLGAAWCHGTFDPLLVNVGLNAQPCIQLYYGQTLCGDTAVEFCNTYYGPGNSEACDTVLGR